MEERRNTDLFVSLGDIPLGISGRLKPGQRKIDLGVSSPEQLASMINDINVRVLTVVNPADYSVDGKSIISSVFQNVFGKKGFLPNQCSFVDYLPGEIPSGSKVISIDTSGRVSLISVV